MSLGKMIITAGIAATLALSGCSVEQTKQAELPDVDVKADAGNVPEYKVVKTEEGKMPTAEVDAKGGQMPEFDVDTADVEVSTEKKNVKVPKPAVVVEEETVEVPDVDVKMPGDK